MGQYSSSRWLGGSGQGALGLASAYLALFPAPWVGPCEEVVGFLLLPYPQLGWCLGELKTQGTHA